MRLLTVLATGTLHVNDEMEVPFRLQTKNDKVDFSNKVVITPHQELYIVGKKSNDANSLAFQLWGSIAGRLECVGSEETKSEVLKQRTLAAREEVQQQKTTPIAISSVTKKRPYEATAVSANPSKRAAIQRPVLQPSHVSSSSGTSSQWVCIEALPVPVTAITNTSLQKFFGGLTLLSCSQSFFYIVPSSNSGMIDVYVGFSSSSGAELALLRQGEMLNSGGNGDILVRSIRSVNCAESFWAQAVGSSRCGGGLSDVELPSPATLVQMWPRFSGYLNHTCDNKSVKYYNSHMRNAIADIECIISNDFDVCAFLDSIRCMWTESLIRCDNERIDALARLDKSFSFLIRFLCIPPYNCSL